VRPVPTPTPETEPFWSGAKDHVLRIQRCQDCQRAIFYPRIMCPHCASDALAWFDASGRATLHSYVINHVPTPGFSEDGPYALAIVELEEGVKMMSSLVGIPADPEHLKLDMALIVQFEDRGDHSIPVFTQADSR
jgi:uncharacterized OB-fold protein